MNRTDPIADDLAASERARADGDHVLGGECAERARTAALQQGQTARAAQAATMLALHLWRQGLHERAVQIGLEALPVVDALDDAPASIDLRNSLTMAYINLDMPGDALPHAVEALRRARVLGSTLALAWCLNRLSVVYDNLGDVSRAVELQRQAIDAANASGDEDARFSSHVNLASTLRHEVEMCQQEGRRDEALAVAQQIVVALAHAAPLAASKPVRHLIMLSIESTAREVLGDAAAMRQAIDRHQAVAAQSRLPYFLFLGEIERGRLHLLEGDADAACRLIETRLDGDQALHGDDTTLRSLIELRYLANKAAGRNERALLSLEALRTIEQRETRQRIESQSRLLLREVEISNARHETEHLRRQSAELAERAAAATQAALRDVLTGLANRRALDEQLQVWMQTQDSQRKCFAAALIDIDHFKHINDTHGHESGDKVLRELARLLGAGTRGGDLVFRQGGEEFVLLIDVAEMPPAAEVCERLRRSVEEHDWSPLLPSGGVTISIGMTTLADDDDGASLLRRADKALYRAKNEGRNRLVVD